MSNIICSVIIPAYNAERTIIKCLESIGAQTAFDRNLEIIIVNDGSKDKTSEIAKCYLKGLDGYKVIDKPNGGVSSARNVGIIEASGKYVYFCDADDMVIRSTLDKMIIAAKTTDCDILIAKYVTSDHINIPNQDGLITNKLLDRQYIEREILSSYVRGQGPAPIWNKLFKRDVIIQNGLKFDESRTHGEDWAFNIDYFSVAESMYAINDVIYIYNNEGTRGGFEKYGGNIAVGLIDGHKRIIDLNNQYHFYREDSVEFRNATKRFICLCIGYLELNNISVKEKKAFLKNRYVDNAIKLLLKLKKNDLPGWTWKNHVAMRLLKDGRVKSLIILHYKLKLMMIPNYSSSC